MLLISFGVLLLCFLIFLVITFLYNNLYKVISKEQEQKIGKILFDNTIKEYALKDSSSLLLQTFINELHFDSSQTVKIVVVRKPELNAFALPGAYIVVYDSMLRSTQNYQELAALLAHEYSHVQLRHALKSTFNQMGMSLLFQVFSDQINSLAHIALNLNNLHYSRKLESEADANAVILLRKNKIHPHHIKTLFYRMQNLIPQDAMLEFLKTHPDFETRIQQLNEQDSVVFSETENLPLKQVYEHLMLQEKKS